MLPWQESNSHPKVRSLVSLSIRRQSKTRVMHEARTHKHKIHNLAAQPVCVTSPYVPGTGLLIHTCMPHMHSRIATLSHVLISNHASTDPKSIVLPLDDPGIICRRGANRTPKALKHRFYRAARFHLRTTLRICRVTRIRTGDLLRPRQARTTKLLYYPMY